MKKHLFLFTLLLLLSIQISSASLIWYNSMPAIKEDKDNWCWNATAKMIASYRYNVTKTQTSVATQIFWPFGAPDSRASIQETGAAVVLYTDSTKSTGYTESESTFIDIFNKMSSSKNPIIATIIHDINYDDSHAIAIKKANTIGNLLTYVDPEYALEFTSDYETIFNYSSVSENGGMVYFLDGEW